MLEHAFKECLKSDKTYLTDAFPLHTFMDIKVEDAQRGYFLEILDLVADEKLFHAYLQKS